MANNRLRISANILFRQTHQIDKWQKCITKTLSATFDMIAWPFHLILSSISRRSSKFEARNLTLFQLAPFFMCALNQSIYPSLFQWWRPRFRFSFLPMILSEKCVSNQSTLEDCVHITINWIGFHWSRKWPYVLINCNRCMCNIQRSFGTGCYCHWWWWCVL